MEPKTLWLPLEHQGELGLFKFFLVLFIWGRAHMDSSRHGGQRIIFWAPFSPLWNLGLELTSSGLCKYFYLLQLPVSSVCG